MSTDNYLERIRRVSSSAGIDSETVSSDYNNIDTSADVDDSIAPKVNAFTAGELIVRNNLLPQTIDEAREQTESKTYQKEEDIYKHDHLQSPDGR